MVNNQLERVRKHFIDACSSNGLAVTGTDGIQPLACGADGDGENRTRIWLRLDNGMVNISAVEIDSDKRTEILEQWFNSIKSDTGITGTVAVTNLFDGEPLYDYCRENFERLESTIFERAYIVKAGA